MYENRYTSFLYRLAVAAGHVMKMHRLEDGTVAFELKPDGTRVTLADKEIGKLAQRLFADAYPGCVLIREEDDFPNRKPLVEGRRLIELILDEVDGTDDYSNGGTQAVFAGVFLENHKPQVSVIYSALGDTTRCYVAARGRGAGCNSTPINVSQDTGGKLRIAVTTAGASTELYDAPALIEALNNLGHEVVMAKSISRTCARVAEGALDGVVFPWTTLHDIAPGAFLIQEAGGLTTDLFSLPFDFSRNSANGLIGANKFDTYHMLVNEVAHVLREPA